MVHIVDFDEYVFNYEEFSDFESYFFDGVEYSSDYFSEVFD